MPLPQRQPEPKPPRTRPELVPPPSRPRPARKWWLAAAILAAIGAGVWWQLQPQPGFDGGAGGGIAAATPTAVAEDGDVIRTLRVTGTTAAEKYANIVSPRLRGSRSRRGATAGGTVGIESDMTVSSTSSLALSSTSSTLSQTGLVATSSGAAERGGGASGGTAGASSTRFGATTGRVGGGGRSGGAGNVQVAGQATATAMGESGLGSTASNLSGGGSGPPAIGGGGGGGGRSRGDFHTALQKLVPAGTMVKAGDVIAEFDRQYMETRLEDYESAVVMHKANLDKKKSDVEVARKAHTNSVEASKAGLEKAQIDLRSIPVLSEIQAERTRLALEEAKAEYQRRLDEVKFQRVSERADVQETQLEVREAEVELERAENNVEKLVVRAPIDGMVVLMSTFRNGEFGQVKEGDELWPGQPFLQVVDTSSMVIDARVNQVDVEKLRIGQPARVTFDAFPGLELTARVYSIGTVAKARQYRPDYLKEVPIRLKMEGSDPRVIPDLTVAADVVLETSEEGPVVPRGAVFRDGQDSPPYVYVKRGSGWERRDVELGMRNHLFVAIRSGLKPGEEVATEKPVEQTK